VYSHLPKRRGVPRVRQSHRLIVMTGRRAKKGGRYTPPKSKLLRFDRPSESSVQFMQPITVAERDLYVLDPKPLGLMLSVVPVLIRGTDAVTVTPVGTAFCVAHLHDGSSLFATARHVIEPVIDNIKREPFVLLPHCADGLVTPADLRGARIIEASVAESNSDVALLVVVTDASIAKPKRLALSFSAPRIGENCLAIGYLDMRVGVPISTTTSEWGDALGTSRGRIEKVHPAGRGRNPIGSFPSFRFSATYPSGVSGGPIIDTSGRTIGIASTSYESRQGPATSFGALTAALIELGLELPSPADGKPISVTFSEVASEPAMGINEPSVRLSRSEDGPVIIQWDASPARASP
jgi:hypothetical protein